MQPMPQNQFYPQLANRLREITSEHEIELSDYSQELVELSMRAWFEDPILFRSGVSTNEAQLLDLGVRIYERALEKPHVQIEMKKRGIVSFGALLVSLGEAGRDILNDLTETGF